MKDHSIYLKHILECICVIQDDYYAGLNNPRQLFEEDDKTRQATLHRLQTLGESVKRIPDDIRQNISPDTDWQAIADFRNVLVHEYLGVDLDIVWNVVASHLPVLRQAIETYLERQS